MRLAFGNVVARHQHAWHGYSGRRQACLKQASVPRLDDRPPVRGQRVHGFGRSGDRGDAPPVRTWLTDWNEHPRPFAWTKTADEILDKVAAYCQRISDSGR